MRDLDYSQITAEEIVEPDKYSTEEFFQWQSFHQQNQQAAQGILAAQAEQEDIFIKAFNRRNDNYAKHCRDNSSWGAAQQLTTEEKVKRAMGLK